MGDDSSETETQTKATTALHTKFVIWVFMSSFSGDGWKPKQLGEFGTIGQFWNIF